MQSTDAPIDLHARARQEMLDADFQPDIPPAVLAEVQALLQPHDQFEAPVRDLRSLLWSSIDNPESRDLDQVEVAERQPDGSIRLRVGIADVDALVPRSSLTDQYAAINTTSVYTGVETFAMLPAELSTDRTSLLPQQDRFVIVVDLLLATDGTVRETILYRGLIRNHVRLDYAAVGAWLEAGVALPASVAEIPGLLEQLRWHDEAATRLYALRQQNGALDFETIEARPVIEGERVVDLAITRKNRARLIIENIMIGANTAIAAYLSDRQMPAIQRVVRKPERWSRIVAIAAELDVALPAEPDAQALAAFLARRRQADPVRFPDLSLAIVKLLGSGDYTVVLPGERDSGHFGLAVSQYAHSTAPNRRYADLITQRLLKAVLAGNSAPYTGEELAVIAERCNERASAARSVERSMRKIAAVVLLSARIGETFDALVTGVSKKGTFVRLLAPPAEGRVVTGEAGLDIGDTVRVRLTATDLERGFIDFARIEN